MKQKLLNSFTWRGTLLVALLSCAFSSAWGQGQTDPTATLTFSSNATSVTADDVTWGIANGSYSDNSWKSSSSTACTFTTTSSIKGKIKSIVVNAKASQSNKTTVDVMVNSSALGSTVKPGTDYKDYTFKKSDNSAVDVDGTNKIVVSAKGANGGKTVYIKSITVYYESDPQFVISSACYGLDANNVKRNFGTYSYDRPFKVPAAGDNDVKVYTVSIQNTNELDLNPVSANTIVPANTGVLVSAKFSENNATYPAVATLASGNAITGNLLVASSKEMSTVTGNNKFYHLSMVDGNIGFYWGNSNGTAWDFNGSNNDENPNKAYLAVPQNSGNSIKGFAFGDGTNSIKGVESEKSESNAIYNLAGQRVSKMQKGLYIVNGKKMIQR